MLAWFWGATKKQEKVYITPWIIVKRKWNHCCILFGTRTRTFGWRFEIFSASLLKQWNEWLNHRPDCRHWIKGKFDRKHLWFWCQKSWFPGVSSRFWRLGPICPLLNNSALQLRRLQAPDPPALALDVRMNHQDRWLVHGGLLAEMGNCNHNGGIKATIMGHLMG